MYYKEHIGIVGQGFVGGALREGMMEKCNVWTYDKFRDDLSNVSGIEELANKSRIIFVCVPTPMFKNGQCDTSILESVIQELDEASENDNDDIVAVIKSTIPPGMTEYLNETYKHLDVVFNPEFLTEKNSVSDFKNQNRIILGGSLHAIKGVAEVYRNVFPNVSIIGMESKAAEMVKYVTNVMLMTKVVLLNEIKQICDKMDIPYEGVAEAAKFDERLGQSHWKVPGPDGIPGAGGHCFPKDLNALRYVARMAGVEPKVMNAVWEKNLEVRESKDRDWEQMKGRAVV